MKEALVLFSGGKDSFLSTILTIEENYKVNLVTFENSCGLQTKNSIIGAKRIQKKYGIDKVNILGIKKIDAIWRELICDFYNLDTEYITKEYGKITISQWNCLSCRLAMYILSIIICKYYNINYVVDGARESQLFIIEHKEMIKRFTGLFKRYNININYPLIDEHDDFSIKNQILYRGFIPKMNEHQCLLGMPITENDINDEIIEGIINVYEKYLYPKVDKIITKYSKIICNGEYL